MPMFIDEEEDKREAALAAAKLKLVERDREAHRKHELAMVKARAEMARAGKRSVSRIEAVQRILIAIVKLPTIPLVMGLIRRYKRNGEEVPQQLWDYLNL